MKKNGFAPILIILSIAILGVVGYFIYKNSVNQNMWPALKDVDITSISVKDISAPDCKTNKEDYIDCLAEVHINGKNGKEYLLLTTDNVVTDSRTPVFTGKFVYLIKRIGNSVYPSNDWTDELWKYNDRGQSTKLFSVQGLTFVPSTNDKLIAVTSGSDKISFIDGLGNVVKESPLNQLGDSRIIEQSEIGLDSWTSDDSTFWGDLWMGPAKLEFFTIMPSDWSVKKYNLSGLNIGTEVALNPNKGIIAFSDYPAIFDSDSLARFQASKKTVTLYLYDLKTGIKTSIATSQTKQFEQKWVDENTIGYDNPNGSGKLEYILK